MPKSRLDPFKRKCAQALNHIANAVIDINEVYEAFGESIERMKQADADNETNANAEAITRYEGHREHLKQTMMYLVIPRNEILEFIQTAWGLDEDSIKVYLG